MNENDKSEGFLSRWSRRKQEEPEELEEPTKPNESVDPLDSDANGTLPRSSAELENVPPPAPLTDEDMPDLETMNQDSDYSGFMSPKVSDGLRKLALRKMFQGDEFNIRDGLDDYDDDYTKFEPLGNIVTSDMKHMIEVEARRELEKTSTREPTTMTEMTPRETALSSIEQFQSAQSSWYKDHHSWLL